MTIYNDQLSQYISDLFATQDQAQKQACEDLPKLGLPTISISPEEGRFIQFLARASGAKLALELGTLGGLSGIWILRGLAEDGRLITLERDAERAQIAHKNFTVAQLSNRVEVRVGEIRQLLPELVANGPFDFVFIDADKPNYPHFFEWAIENVRLGGVIAVHNAFRHGDILKEDISDENTLTIRALNRQAANNPRLISTIFPAGDGILLAVKIA